MINEVEIQSYFDKSIHYHMTMATRKDAVGYNYHEKVGWFISQLCGIEGRLLNVGCNVGNLEFFIREKGISPDMLQLIGVDIVEKTIEVAKSRDIPGTTFRVGNALNLDFPSKTFDAAIMMEVIEHIADQVKAIREIARVLKPGGIILLSTPNAECKPWLFDERLRFLAWRMLGKKLVEKDNLLTLPELRQILLKSSLTPLGNTRYYWYRPFHIFKGRLFWPPAFAAKGLLNVMKHCKKIEESNCLTDEQKQYYCQSIVAVAKKKT
jgi:SAM-dependent methyltransferase